MEPLFTCEAGRPWRRPRLSRGSTGLCRERRPEGSVTGLFRLKITLYGEDAFRVLAYLAEHDDRRCTTGEIAAAYRVNENHLKQVAYHLGKAGIVRTYRGKGGGLELAWAPSSINLGKVFQVIERDLGAVDFEPLVPIMQEALDAYLAVLDRYTLEDVVRGHRPCA